MYVSLLNKCRHHVMTLVSLIVVSVLLTGCIGQLPGDSLEGAENMDLTLAGDIERESRRNFSQNVVSGAVWNAQTGSLHVQGLTDFDDDDDISILNATTRQVLLPSNFRVRRLDDDDGRRGIVLNNLSTIPCSITVTTSRGVQQIPVQNAPFNCAGAQIAPLGGVNITEAKWSNSSARLSVKGSGALPNQVVSVFDTATGLYLGSDQANSVGSWRVRVRNVFPIPCSISASANGLVAQARVANAPVNACSGSLGGVPVPVGSFPPAFPSTGIGSGIFGAAPESVIQSPLTDLTIPVGTSINFIGYGFDPTNASSSSLNFRWSFGGTSFMRDQSGPVADMLFTTPGIYYVTLTVSNSLGFSDPTPATRLVIVQDTTAVPVGNVPGTNPSFNPPEGYIVEPAQQQNIVITAGQALNFFANGFDPDSTLPLVYHWNFGGAAPNMTGQSPGAVIFSTPGVYMVSLVVADSTGVMDPTPDYRTVTVVGNPVNPGFNQPPQGMIISPATDTQIPVGGSVNFMANGTDPENNTPLAYRWDFGGATSARTTQNPGQVTFNTPGTYYVTLTVSDSLGAFDPTPETRVIRVGGGVGGVVGGINNLAPESLIVQPTTDQTISVGQSVVFAGQGNDPELDTQLIYRWDFDGAMPSTLVQNPGAVTFSQPGSYRIRLAVSDSQGATDATPAVRNITVVGNGNTFNQPPNGVIIDPSINMSISVGQSLSFSAIGNDPEGSLLTYTWDFGGQIPNETGQVTSPITFNRAGVYRVTLIARDDQGARDATPDMRVITVIGNSAAQPPVASIASPMTDITINQGSSVNFYGTGSRLGSFTTPLTYRWEVTGGFVSIPNANVASPGLINFPTAGVYNVKFTVSDGLASDSVTRKVTVLGQSTNPPTATITATSSLPGVGTVPVGSQMQFNGTAFGGFAPYTYMWNFDGAVADSSLQNPSVTFNRPGAYDIKLYVTDSQGVRSLASAAYRVTVGNGSIGVIPAPQIVTNPQILNTINVGQTVNFSAFSSGGFGAGQVYRWNFDGAVPNSLAQNPGNVTFNRVGTYYITLKVSDQSGATSSPATLAVNVVSNGSFGSPFPGTGQGTGTGTINAVIQSPSSNVAINCGVPFTFQAANLGASVSYNWTIKNGATTELTRNGLNLSSLNATFYKAGSYTVELTASSNIGSDLTPDIRNFQVVNNGSCTGGAISSGSFGSGVGTGVGTGVGQAPNGNITSPVSDLTLRKGQSLNFVAQSFDPTGAQGAGVWDFGTLSVGTTVNTTALNAGSVVFNQTGVFVIRFTARNSSGVSDPTPSIRVITVLP